MRVQSTNKNTTISIALILVFVGTALTSNAAVIQTVGTGSAVTSVDASANFESNSSLLFAYVEGGMTFRRVNYTVDNNGCGFAGCSSTFHPFGFVGNYFYGNTFSTQFPSYFQILANNNRTFVGLEFLTGWGSNTPHYNIWEAYLDGNLVGSGTSSYNHGTVLGYGSMSFDELRFSSNNEPLLNGFGSFGSSAIDSVRAQFSPAQVPEAPTLALIIVALAGFGFYRRQPKTRNKYAAV